MALKRINADFEHYKVVEFDKFAIKSYNAVHDTNFKTMDIKDVNAEDLNICDADKYTYLLTYSFPCTDISNAGQRKGMAKNSGTRSGLLWEVNSKTQLYKQFGNSIVVDVMCAMFLNLDIKRKKEKNNGKF